MTIVKSAGKRFAPPVSAAEFCAAEVPSKTWRRSLKDWIVRWGIQAICGKGFDLMPEVAADIPLGTASVRYAWLRMLEMTGREAIVARSGLGYDFVCHIGDLSEFPYYHRQAHKRELLLCARWLSRCEEPVVLDVGANTGFFVTQLAQMTSAVSTSFYAFEAIPSTYSKLAASIRGLGLDTRIRPIAAPVLDKPREVYLECNNRNSLVGRVMTEGERPPCGAITGRSITLDSFCEANVLSPSLLKIDVEGWEPAVLRGASEVIGRARPGVLFEHNPERGCIETAALLRDGPLQGYRLFYVDDLRGQLLPFGSGVGDIGSTRWICNLFAVPEESAAGCADIFAEARGLL
jgi:FkbM family methyltransferase